MITINAYAEKRYYLNKYGDKKFIEGDGSGVYVEAAILTGKGLKSEEELVYTAVGETEEEAKKAMDNYLTVSGKVNTISRFETNHPSSTVKAQTWGDKFKELTKAQRTGGVWKTKTHRGDVVVYTDSRLGKIATVYGEKISETLANAAFIVTACNAHDSLVEALREITEDYEHTLKTRAVQHDILFIENSTLTKAKEALNSIK